MLFIETHSSPDFLSYNSFKYARVVGDNTNKGKRKKRITVFHPLSCAAKERTDERSDVG